MSTEPVELDPGIFLLETGYIRPGMAAAWLAVGRGRVALLEPSTLPAGRLLAALAELGLGPEAVDWVVVTHVHLDHAAAAGALLRVLPRARLAVHPRGARHLVDPSRLEAAARAVYGDARFEELYGTLHPAPAGRVHATSDGERLPLGDGELVVLHAPGHALHHQVVWDPATRGLWSGDACGVSYPHLVQRGPAPLFPSTAPSQFDPEQMEATLSRLEGLGPRRLYLTHYGARDWEPGLFEGLRAWLRRWTGLARAVEGRPGALERLEAAILGELVEIHAERGTPPGLEPPLEEQLRLDAGINAQGLLAWLARLRRPA